MNCWLSAISQLQTGAQASPGGGKIAVSRANHKRISVAVLVFMGVICTCAHKDVEDVASGLQQGGAWQAWRPRTALL